jgi:hypothetical protein
LKSRNLATPEAIVADPIKDLEARVRKLETRVEALEKLETPALKDLLKDIENALKQIPTVEFFRTAPNGEDFGVPKEWQGKWPDRVFGVRATELTELKADKYQPPGPGIPPVVRISKAPDQYHTLWVATGLLKRGP